MEVQADGAGAQSGALAFSGGGAAKSGQGFPWELGFVAALLFAVPRPTRVLYR